MTSPRRAPRLMWPPAWSFTLHRLLHGPHRCERAVYWRYAAARLGARAPHGSDEHRAWVLSHLTALPLLSGIVLHNAARAVFLAIRDGQPLPRYAELLGGARFTLNHVWLTSTRHLDRFYRWPGAYTAFREVVYHGALRDVEVARVRWTLSVCLEHLLAAPLLDDLRRCHSEEILVGNLPTQFQATPGVSAWAALDLAYVHHDPAACGGLVTAPTWCIVDVKTTAPPANEAAAADEAANHALQLATYALFASEVLRLPATDNAYLGRIVHLRQQSDAWFRITADDVERVRSILIADTASLRDRLPDPAPGQFPAKTAFPLSDDQRRCARCPFYALCRDELQARECGEHDTRRPSGDSQ